METKTETSCANCPMRAKYDAKPKSFAGRFWRWHINWCPGWKKYMKALNDDERNALILKYNLKKKFN